MSEVLSAHGYRVLEATDGLDAIRIARQHGGALDVLVSDLVMPRMHGTDMFQQLTQDYPRLRCVFMSGYSEAMVKSELATMPGARVLQKPFTDDVLLRALREALTEA